MNCPYCGHYVTRVSNSRLMDGGNVVERRRRCEECGERFKTREAIQSEPLIVVKRDGSRQRFSRQKIVGGLMRACEKRPVSPETLDKLARDVERRLFASGGEMTSVEIGETLLGFLAEIDEVSAIRFASVFEQFESGCDFLRQSEELAKLRGAPAADPDLDEGPSAGTAGRARLLDASPAKSPFPAS